MRLTFLLLALCLQQASAATWYFLRWTTPSSSSQFTKFSMQMVVPRYPPQKGTYYLWPGLQDTGNTGVYQHVLDGRSGQWRIAAGWCCKNPDLPWGDGFNVVAGNKVDMVMSKDSADTNWTSTTTLNGGLNGKPEVAKNAFPLGTKNMNQAILAIELYDVSWDFGPLVWNNVVMVMSTTQTGWCTGKPEDYSGTLTYNMTTPRATTSGGSTTCTIDQIVFQKPAK